MRTTKYILILIALISNTVSFAQNKKARMAQIMQQYHQYNMFDGTVLVAENGKLVYKAAFGPANREWNIPNTIATKFMIGSVSKPITSMLALIQVQKGLLSLDKTIADYLPAFVGKPAANITIRQLLSHTSGMPNYDIMKDFFPKISRQNFTREEYIKVYMDSALLFPPGTKHFYSSWGFFTLGYIMEKVSGKSYAELMQQDIYSKTGMKNTGSYFHTQIVPNRATGYDYSFGGFTSSDFRDQSNAMGTGDLYSTVEDLFAFHLAISNNTLLNKKLTDEMLAPGAIPPHYGYGWYNRQFRFGPTDTVAANFHLGMTNGFISFALRIPSTNSFVVILCNSAPTDFFGIVGNLVRVLYNKPVTLKEPLHKKMEGMITSMGATKAVAVYQQLQNDTARYYVDWISMSLMAEQLLTLKRYEEARIIGENNVAFFAKYDRVMAVMGDIYLALNRKEEAITYYKKTLAITPTYEEAITKLRQLGQ